MFPCQASPCHSFLSFVPVIHIPVCDVGNPIGGRFIVADKVRLGFIGAGNMGQHAHIHNYAQLTDECELVAVADVRPELAKKVAARYGIAETYTSHTELLENADVDAVVAIMGYALHHNVVPDVLRAGKHLLTEKPIGCRADTAAEWKKLAAERDLVYLVGYMKRWDLGVRYVVDLVRRWQDSGEYGELNYLGCTMSGTDWTWNAEGPITSDEKIESTLVPEPFPEKFTGHEADLYNIQINFYVHQINLMRFILGEDYTLDYNHPSGKILAGTTESGIPITLEMSLHTISHTWDEVYRISFEKADITLRMPAPLQKQRNGEVEIRTDKGDAYEVMISTIFPPSWGFFEQAKGFLAAVRAGKAPHDSVGDAIKDLLFFERQVEMMSEA